MKAHYSSRGRSAKRHGPGRAIEGKLLEVSTITQRRLEAKIYNIETHILCTECGRVVPRRKDGTMKGHRSQGVIPCIGATSRVNGVDH